MTGCGQRAAEKRGTSYGHNDGGVALFSIIKWPCFRLSKFRQDIRSGLLFDQQMVLFSVDKNRRLHRARGRGWPGRGNLSAVSCSRQAEVHFTLNQDRRSLVESHFTNNLQCFRIARPVCLFQRSLGNDGLWTGALAA